MTTYFSSSGDLPLDFFPGSIAWQYILNSDHGANCGLNEFFLPFFGVSVGA